MKDTRRARDVAKRMRILEKQYKMSVREIAKVVGVNFYIVSFWRNQKVNISMANYEKVCNNSCTLITSHWRKFCSAKPLYSSLGRE